MPKCLILAIFWLAHPTVHAEPELSLAFKGGRNASTSAHDYRFNRYGSTGGLAGYLQWSLLDRLSLGGQMELLYTPRGSKTIFEGDYLGKVRMHYVDLMVAARPEARLGPASGYLLLGGGVSLLLSASKAHFSSDGMRDITDDLHRLDVALLVGAGVALHLPRWGLGRLRLGTVFVEARHDHGLRDTDAVNGGYENRTSSLMLGLSFAVVPGARSSAPAACRCP